jgi:large subunit ribosomal protein L23
MMRDAREVIVSPMITEKSTRTMEDENVYTFLVDEKANKIEIKSAVERLWDVDVIDVRTMRYSGKARRSMMGRMSRNARQIGRRPSFKKAMVVLAEGDHIEFYELG